MSIFRSRASTDVQTLQVPVTKPAPAMSAPVFAMPALGEKETDEERKRRQLTAYATHVAFGLWSDIWHIATVIFTLVFLAECLAYHQKGDLYRFDPWYVLWAVVVAEICFLLQVSSSYRNNSLRNEHILTYMGDAAFAILKYSASHLLVFCYSLTFVGWIFIIVARDGGDTSFAGFTEMSAGLARWGYPFIAIAIYLWGRLVKMYLDHIKLSSYKAVSSSIWRAVSSNPFKVEPFKVAMN